jgi:uncharacterized protein with PQ loop repeat
MNLLAPRDITPRLAAGEAAARTPIERLIYVAAFVVPFTSVPQILEIWVKDKSAAGVSFLTWGFFLVMSGIWLLYGISKRDRPLIISNALWIIAEAIIMAGAIYYDKDLL